MQVWVTSRSPPFPSPIILSSLPIPLSPPPPPFFFSSFSLGTGGGFDTVSVVSESSGLALASSAERLAQGRAQLQEVNRTWGLLNRVRMALRQRVAFLKVRVDDDDDDDDDVVYWW